MGDDTIEFAFRLSGRERALDLVSHHLPEHSLHDLLEYSSEESAGLPQHFWKFGDGDPELLNRVYDLG